MINPEKICFLECQEKIKEVTKEKRDNYLEKQSQIILKYKLLHGNEELSNIFWNSQGGKLALADQYKNQIETEHAIPMVLTTDFKTELQSIETTSHHNLVNDIDTIYAECKAKIAQLEAEEKELTEGDTMERNIKMAIQFEEDYGYNPMEFGRENINQNCIAGDESSDEDDDEEDEIDRFFQENSSETETMTEEEDKVINETKVVKPKFDPDNQIFTLETLNQIAETSYLDFGLLATQLIDKKKLKLSSKVISELQSLIKSAAVLTPATIIDNSLSSFVSTHFNKDGQEKTATKKKISDRIAEGVESAYKIARHYQEGKILIKSPIKSFMIYIYLIKKYSHANSMYYLGKALYEGDYISKNHKQGLKLLKKASEGNSDFAKKLMKTLKTEDKP